MHTDRSLQPRSQLRAFLIGGLLPVIAFTVIEEKYGVAAGVVAGMVFGAGEIIYEWRKQGRVSGMTWGGNAMILVLGAVSLLTEEGIWFKLQPAILEAVFALVLWGSLILGKPLLVSLAQKQGKIPTILEPYLAAFTGRLGGFFALHAALATWAALYWSTSSWALLKGIGFTLSLLVYMVAETILLRYRIASKRN